MRIKLSAACFLVGSLLAPMAVVHAADDIDMVTHPADDTAGDSDYLAAQAAADTDTDRAHPMNFVKDSAITTKIKAKLAAEHLNSMKDIKVDTDSDGVVWLSGYVSSKDQMEKAESIAHDTEGVKMVKNHIRVQSEH